MNKVISISAFLMASVIFSSQANAFHVKGFVDEVVVRHKEGTVFVGFSSQDYEENMLGCATWYHKTGFKMADDPTGALYSLIMMSKMSGTKVYLALEGNCLPNTGVAEIREGRTGVH